MRIISLVVLGVAAVATSGCMSSGSSNVRAEVKESGYNSDIDWALVNFITDDAQKKGYKIVWVHPPQKKNPPRNQ